MGKKLEDFTETLERYKRWYPENCEGRDDIEILLYRRLITDAEAVALRNPVRPEPRIRTKRRPRPKVKVWTDKQFEKVCKDIRTDVINDLGTERLEDCCYDLAEGLLATDHRYRDYLNRCGVEPKFHKESLADLIHG